MTYNNIKAGDVLPPLVLEPISRRTLALFAGGSNDHQAVHLDIDVARGRGRPDVIAHGMLSMAYLGRLLTGWIPQQRVRSFKVRFAAVTPVLARPTCSGTVTSLKDGLAMLDLVVKLEDGTVTAKGEAVIDVS
jgi:acyl dehydratase